MDVAVPFRGTSNDATDLHCGPDETMVVLVDQPAASDRALRRLRDIDASVVLLATAAGSTRFKAALESGVIGVLTVDDRLTELRRSLESASRGEQFASTAGLRLVFQHLHDRPDRAPSRRGVPLSRRERDVLRAMAAGLTTKHIARDLGIAIKTVEAHKSRLFMRLEVENQNDAVTRAILDPTILG